MHPLMWMVLIVLGLYACGGLETPRRDPPRSQQVTKIPDRVPMTEAEKRFGCREVDTTPNGECP
jgi:hypothetical protein